MSDAATPHGPLRLEGILNLLPESETLRPLVEHLVGASRPDPERHWSGSGELGTAGARLVAVENLREELQELAAAEGRRLRRHYGAVGELARALAEGDGEGAVEEILGECHELETEGRVREARNWAQAARSLARRHGSLRLAEALRREARCARTLGEVSEAARLYEEAFRRGKSDGRWADAVVAATGRGNVSVDRGRWEEAEEWYGRALALLEDGSPPLDPGVRRALRWRLFQNLGITARERGALEEADERYREAEAEAAPLDDPAAEVEVENGRGQLDLARGEPRRAELRFRRALAALGPEPGEAGVVVRVNLGTALLRQDRALEAGEVAREAEALALRARVLRRLPEVYRLLAEVAVARGEPEAFIFLDRALELIRNRGLPPFEEAVTLEAYARIRGREGEEEVARDASRRAREIFAELGIDRPRSGTTEPENGGETQ